MQELELKMQGGGVIAGFYSNIINACFVRDTQNSNVYCSIKSNLFILYHNNIDVNDLVAIIIIILFIHYYYYLHILVLFFTLYLIFIFVT